MRGKRCTFNLRPLNAHCPKCPSVDLKYTLPPFSEGETYQLPHRSLATSGKPAARSVDRVASLTEVTKRASAEMEARRERMLRRERVDSRAKEEMEREAEGKRSDESAGSRSGVVGMRFWGRRR